jgi:crotonobetainyl-CoA:carnitine CoA-transferase CaiB-like acyl-CoA transferase
VIADLTTTEGRSVALDLVAEADVFVTNVRREP